MSSVRLIVDPPASGAWNMGVDQALLDTVNQTGEMVVRFYTWEAPTLSLGYFQPIEQRLLHTGSLGCPVVRRSTGGGAILHDAELTYSICVPSKNRWSKSNEELYWKVHRGIVEILQSWQISAGLHGDTFPMGDLLDALDDPITLSDQKKIADRPEPFLCFQRRTDGDVVLDRFKICGSAQRRKQNAVLQHGSLLFRRSPMATELPGILDLAADEGLSNWPNRAVSDHPFFKPWVAKLEEILEAQFERSDLTANESARSFEFERLHRSEDWVRKR